MATPSSKGPSTIVLPRSNLPADVLDLIVKRLDSPTDIRSFRSVCKSWRASASLLPPNLLSLVLPVMINSHPLSCMESFTQQLSIIPSNIYILKPLHSSSDDSADSKPWLIRVEEVELGKLRVLEPLTHHKPIELSETFPSKLILSRLKVIQVFTGYNFNINCQSSFKLILYSPSQISESAPSLTDLISTKALVLTAYGELYLGDHGNWEWNQIKAVGDVIKFDDIIRFGGCNYTVDYEGRLYSFTCHQWSEPRSIVSGPIHNYSTNVAPRKRLMKWCGELFLVLRDENVIKVYKLNEEAKEWHEVPDLGGKLLFVATDCCFFASVENFPGWRKNTVIFDRESFLRDDGDWPNSFNMRELYISVYEWGTNSCYKASSYRGDLDMFWPPPTWVW